MVVAATLIFGSMPASPAAAASKTRTTRRVRRVRTTRVTTTAKTTPKAAPVLSAPTTTSTTAAPTTTAAPVVQPLIQSIFAETFETAPSGTWADGSTQGQWYVQYNGYGSVGKALDGTSVVSLSPKASTSPDETHAAMVTSSNSLSGDIDLTARIHTVQQLRTGSAPNAWETGWLVWNYGGDEHFYYLILKPNGWELGKSDNSRLDPAGPVCTWPSYVNCLYPGAQRYLATGSSPTFAVGSWHVARVVQVGSTIKAYGDGLLLGTVTDSSNTYTSGKLGLYTEDARVSFDDILVTRPTL